MFLFPRKKILSNKITPLNVVSIQDLASLQNIAGYVSYECYTEIEDIFLPKNKPFCQMPKIHFSTLQKENFSYSISGEDFIPKVKWIKSNFTDEENKNAVQKILDYIKKGTVYQVNLTRKFYGEFEEKPNALAIFNKLYEFSPNPYAMLYKIDDDRWVISSSPECFLKREGQKISSIPIKGTIDSILEKNELRNFKDNSENLMITDLVRNDIGKISNRVWVDGFQKIDTYGQVHHMSSNVCGNLLECVSNTDCFLAAFPAGSMTGAPKIKAIEIANELEKMQRGIYSGAIGIINDEKNFDFGVVIRTILIEGRKFEFQAGGAVVWDSVPEKEVAEMYLKLKGIFATIGINNLTF